MTKMIPIVFALGLLGAPAVALAQAAPSPDNQSGPGVNATVPSPTDMGIGSQSSNTIGIPERRPGSVGYGAGIGTTGAGVGMESGEAAFGAATGPQFMNAPGGNSGMGFQQDEGGE